MKTYVNQLNKKKYSNLFWNANNFRKRVRNDWDLVLAITGEEGVGKSSLAFWLSILIDKKIDLSKSFTFSADTYHLIKQVKDIEQYGVVVLDEAIKALYKRDWASKAQRVINKVYTTIRYQNKITILCIPNFTDLTSYFRNYRVKVWIHVYSRGKAAVFFKPRVLHSDDPWFLKQHDRLRKKTKDSTLIDDDEFEYYLAKCRGFIGFLHFPDVPDDVGAWFRYKKSRHEDEDLEDEAVENNFVEERNLCVFVLNSVLGITQDSIARLLSKGRKTTISSMVVNVRPKYARKFDAKFSSFLQEQVKEKLCLTKHTKSKKGLIE